jgi:putative transposase
LFPHASSASDHPPAPQAVRDGSDAHHRRSIRLKGYDYTLPGAYFVTILTAQREPFFDDPVLRKVAEDCWREIPRHATTVELDHWVVLPDHLHGLILLGDLSDDSTSSSSTAAMGLRRNDRIGDISPRSGSLSVIIRTYKAAVTTACRRMGRDDFAWQRNYHKHIVRTERALDAIRRYIMDNPRRRPDAE